MERKLYYSIDKEIEDGEFVTGNKTVDVYEISNNTLSHFCTLDLELSDNSEDAINDYLNDNGYEDETFVFVRL